MIQRKFLFPAVLLLLLSALLVTVGVSADDGDVAVQVDAGKVVCFYEDITVANVKVFLHYLVTSGGAMDIDCKVTAPDDKVIWESEKETENRVLFKSRTAGTHAFCFSNRMSTVSPKVVSLSVTVGSGGTAKNQQDSNDSLQRTISRLKKGLGEIEEIQQYLRGREHEHRSTTEVANTRVVLFCLLESIIIVAMGVGSVWYLRKIFITKRMV